MGRFYSGFGGHKAYLGHCEDGIIYSGSGNHTPIGRYEGGIIYNQFKKYIGSYSCGSIYNTSGTHIASYDNGNVYNKYLNAVFGREQVGSYENDPAEAAALVLLFLGGNVINEKKDVNTPTPTPTPSPSYDSNTGCLSALVGLIYLLLKLLNVFFKFYFLYFMFPFYASTTLYYLPLMIFFGVTLELETLMLPIAICCMIVSLSSVPYWVIVFTEKRKKNMTWKETFKYYGLWFIKGPFAYKDIMKLKNK